MKIPEQAVKVFMDSLWGNASMFPSPSHVKAALTAAAPYMSGVKVKQLEWREVKSLVGRKLIASDCFGREFARIDLLNHTHDELDIKKAEYQANYENGILSALEPPSAREHALEDNVRMEIIELLHNLRFRLEAPGSTIDGDGKLIGKIIEMVDAIRALKSQPAQTGAGMSKLKLERTIASYEGMVPEAVAEGSHAQILFALRDARKDILALSSALNTRPAPAPCEELVRYRIWFDNNYNEIVDEEDDGEYVRYKQAEAVIAAERMKLEATAKVGLKLSEKVEALEAENKRLREALGTLIKLNDDSGPFGGEMYQDRVDRAWDAARAALGGVES